MIAFLRRPLPLYLLLCAVAALWIDLSRLHLGQTSDSLIPVLVSLQHWTPFYWEQSRFGMLVPLVAVPFEHPLVNLLVQDGLMIFAGLAAIGLLTRFFIRSSFWFSVACGSCAVFLLCLAEPLRCDYLIAQPYGVSFSLGLGALLFLDRAGTWPRWCAALGMILLASWVNLAVGPALLLVVLARWAGRRFAWRRAPVRLTVLLLAGTLIGVGFEQWAPYRDAHVIRLLPMQHWFESCEALIMNALHQGGPEYRHTLLILLGAAVVGAMLMIRRRRRIAASTLVSLLVAALWLILFAGASRWTAMNAYMPRYIIMALLALQTGLIATILFSARGWLRMGGRQSLSLAGSLCILGAVGFTYGVPSLDTAKRSLEARLGVDGDKVLRDGCTHIAGDYWRVWPAVFHANWKRHERGEAGAVWGVAYRSLPTEHLWTPRGLDGCRVLLLGQDPHAERLLQRHFSFAFAAKDCKLPKS